MTESALPEIRGLEAVRASVNSFTGPEDVVTDLPAGKTGKSFSSRDPRGITHSIHGEQVSKIGFQVAC